MLATLESQQLTSLAVNKDASRVLVGGRSVLKVFNVSEECGLLENLNLKTSKHTPPLDYSTLDVAWSPHDSDMVASSAANGAVLLFNVDSTSRNHQTARFTCHKRAVNRVNFHPRDAYMMITASHEGTVKTLDTRVSDGAPTTFNSHTSDSVRDVQFFPAQPHQFAAGDEGGSIRIWDSRHADRPLKVLGSAHNGPVLSLDFHPKHRFWLASAGRDKKIAVRDMEGPDGCIDHQVLTIQAVNRIRWRPDRDYHIASSSLIMEHSVHVWDIRRPFIPFASFEAHKDTVTAIAWCGDAKNFFTCGKDGLIRRHNFKEAHRPIQFANPVGLATAPDGEIFIAAQKQRQQSSLTTTDQTNRPASRTTTVSRGVMENFFRPKPKLSGLFDRPFEASQYVIRSVDARSSLSMQNFVYLAQMYWLSGCGVSKLCQHNAQVCADIGLNYTQKIWLVLATIVEEAGGEPAAAAGDLPATASGSTNGDLVNTVADAPVAPSNKHNVSVESASSAAAAGQQSASDAAAAAAAGPDSHGHQPPTASATSNDFYFGLPEVSRFGTLEFDKYFDESWRLQRDQFDAADPLAAAVAECSDADLMLRQSSRQSAPTTLSSEQPARVMCRRPPLLRLCSESQLQATNGSMAGQPSRQQQQQQQQYRGDWALYRQAVADVLLQLVDQGCVQSAVSMLIVLGPLGEGLMDGATQQRWHSAYIDLLDRFELYTISTRIIKLLDIRELSQLGTQISLSCPKCNRQLPPASSSDPRMRHGHRAGTCAKCAAPVAICAVCECTVRGLWVSCQVCFHGGHLCHLRNWFSSHNLCPAGCGHKCQTVTET